MLINLCLISSFSLSFSRQKGFVKLGEILGNKFGENPKFNDLRQYIHDCTANWVIINEIMEEEKTATNSRPEDVGTREFE